MTGRTQYGELLGSAGQHILRASLALESDRLPDRAAAEQTVIIYRDLLHALSQHGLQLIGSGPRLLGIRATDDADPRDAVAARLVDHLAYVGQRDLNRERTNTGASASWAAAGTSVRAATDLLATHRDHYGGWRSPDAAWLEDPQVRAAGFGELAAIAIPVAAAATRLALRVGQAGVDWGEVERIVPETGPLLEVALETRRLGGLAGTSLATLGVARPAVRSGDPVIELGDRLARLHRVAWQLTREDRVGAGTLADLALAGVLVNGYASQLLRQATDRGSSSPADLSARRGRGRLEDAGAAWRLIHLHLRQLRTTTPPLPGLRGDLLAVRDLLAQLVVTESPASRHLQAVVVGGARGFGDIAGWNLQTLENLSRTGQLMVPGRYLSGNEVSDHPLLVEAKLKGRLAPVTKDRLDPLRDAYRAAKAPGQSQVGAAASSLGPLGPQPPQI